MRNSWTSSVSLGRWWRVNVRLHFLFVLFALFVLYVSTSQFLGKPLTQGWTIIGILFVSVIMHEAGHVIVTRRLGGQCDDIVIGPLGGLATIRVPYEPQSELVALTSGILVNAGACLVAAVFLAFDPQVDLSALLNPLNGLRMRGSDIAGPWSRDLSATTGWKMVFLINWSILLVNLIPAFPFDGGRCLRALLAFLRPELDARQASQAVARLGSLVGVFLLISAFLTGSKGDGIESSNQLIPLWLILTGLASYIFFHGPIQETRGLSESENEDGVFGYDFSQGYTSLERSVVADEAASPSVPAPMGGVQGWFEKRREARERRLHEKEAEDDRRVDEILARLHNHGMRSLSQDDRDLLNRVSQRYRTRHTSE